MPSPNSAIAAAASRWPVRPEQHAVPTARVEADRQEAGDDLRLAGDDPQVGGEGEVHARAHRAAAHGGDRGRLELAHPGERAVDGAQPAEGLRGGGVAGRRPRASCGPRPRRRSRRRPGPRPRPRTRRRRSASQASTSSWAIEWVRALRRSAASRVIVATPSRCSTAISAGMPGDATRWKTVPVSSPVLWHIKVSHYNEKVRWALDHKGVTYKRRAPPPPSHMAVSLVLTRGREKTFPVLTLDGESIGDSTAIIAALERRFPEPPLYPGGSGRARPRAGARGLLRRGARPALAAVRVPRDDQGARRARRVHRDRAPEHAGGQREGAPGGRPRSLACSRIRATG